MTPSGKPPRPRADRASDRASDLGADEREPEGTFKPWDVGRGEARRGEAARAGKPHGASHDGETRDRGKRHGAGPRPRGAGHGGGRSGGRDAARGAAPEAREEGLIFGLHAVRFALENPSRSIRALYLTENAERRIEAAVAARGVAVTRVSPRDLDRRLGADTVHQGALAEVDPLPEPEVADLAAAAGDGPLVLLDQVTDPHNVGAVLRSAAVFGAKGVIMTRRHSPPLDGALAKAASGALELVPIALVQNLARAMEDLKAAGVTLVGLDGDAPETLDGIALDRPVGLVMGAEGKGLRQLTRESCSVLARIGAPGPIASLNVSNAAAIALHLVALRRSGG